MRRWSGGGWLGRGADDEQADFTVLYGSGLDGWIVRDLEKDPQAQFALGLFGEAESLLKASHGGGSKAAARWASSSYTRRLMASSGRMRTCTSMGTTISR